VEISHALEKLGLASFRPGQREVIESVLSGRPTIAVLPTGAGKSLCYQLPAVALGGLTVVVSPLIALMKDQVDALWARGVPATFINSSIDSVERDTRLAAAIDGRVRLLYVAPERFRASGFLARLKSARIELFAVDEAHCITEWGHDFRPEYARLGEVLAELRPPRLVALTATATPDVREEIAARLDLAEPAEFVRGFDRPNLSFAVLRVGGRDDKLAAIAGLLAEPATASRPAVIYTATRKNAEELAERLAKRVSVVVYHAGLDDESRAEAQERFMSGAARVVVATNAFGMGVDKRDVGLVIHADLPGSLEAYYQEAGRAGRDGQAARCVLLFNHGDVRLREFLIESAGADQAGARSPARVAAEKRRLSEMTRYAYARGCRRRYLLAHFGDPEARPRCGGPVVCDTCHSAAAAAPVDDETQLLVRKILATVARVHGRYGPRRVVLTLLGSTAKEIVDAGLDKLSTYGLLAGRDDEWVSRLFGALESAGLVTRLGDEYPVVGITSEGREVMHDRARACLTVPAEQARSTRRRQAKAAPLPTDGTPVDGKLLEALRSARREWAAAKHVPAYCVFHDATLVEIARRKPTDLAALGQISGVGPAKLSSYGDAVLSVLRDAV
jgi:ATP-dependent DNA helicase RecQ